MPPFSAANATYKFYNSYKGPYYSLSVIQEDAERGVYYLQTANTTDFLPWTFTKAQDPSKWNICTAYNGTRRCLDIQPPDKIVPVLNLPAFVTGQQWTISSSPYDGWYKFANEYSEKGYYLDVIGGPSPNKAIMSNATNTTGQAWRIDKLEALPTVPTRGPKGINIGAVCGGTIGGVLVIALIAVCIIGSNRPDPLCSWK